MPPQRCGYDVEFSQIPTHFYTYSLTNKTISGPGLAALEWRYVYGLAFGETDTCTTCAGTSRIRETDPNGNVTRYLFGNRFGENEGKLLQVDHGWNGNSAVRSVQTRYRAPGAGPYPQQEGSTEPYLGDAGTNIRTMPVDKKTTVQQGVTFAWEATGFDSWARPLDVVRTSSLGMTRSETTAYEDNLAIWVVGQVKKITENSTKAVPVLNSYNSTSANLESVSAFGRLDHSLTYHTNGALASRSDGKKQTTSFFDYKRGIPQLVVYPDKTLEQATVNNIGLVESITDPSGHTTKYQFDAMGRLARVTHPLDPDVVWNNTGISYSQAAAEEYGLGAGHWVQTARTGTARTTTYYDALWRAVLTHTQDDNDPRTTSTFVRSGFDFSGRTSYVSYPQNTFEALADGVNTAHDVLGRPTIVATSSEHGTIWSGHTYTTGFSTVFTSGRGLSTTTLYQAFDDPDQVAAAKIVSPLGVEVVIERDIFGKTRSITRTDGKVSATRSYVYDTHQRLCKSIDPETKSTIQDYDAANNVAWRAVGLALPSTKQCDQASVVAASKVSFAYDQLNRIKLTGFGDNSPAIARTYTPDGLPLTVNSGRAAWTYGYNSRRHTIREQLAYGGATYTVGRGMDANGSLAQLRYPDNTVVAYAPNALGQPGRVGPYATGLTYYPNGAIKSFSYGNGIAHTLTQNVRGLPERSVDAGVINDLYSFDKNGNVVGIRDDQESVTSRTMVYDDLDRLTFVTAPGYLGTAGYAYDGLDNLTASVITQGANTRGLIHHYDKTTNLLGSITGHAAYAFAYEYDARGNVKKRGAQGFGFDLGNRLRAASGKATYDYDGWNRRISVVGRDGVNRMQLYTQDGKLLLAGPTNAAKTSYIYLDSHVIAEVGGAGTRYLHTDGLGSPVAKTDAAKAVVSRTRYEPYGHTAGGTSPTIGFTGHAHDGDTGLTYMQQRYYDPVAGRMLSIDPVTSDANTGGGFNRYVYANNSPYKYVDPDGRLAFLIPLIPYVATATVAIVGHHALPGRQGREDTVRTVANAIRSDKADSPTVGNGQRSTKTPNVGAPGSTHVNPGSGQEREYGADGLPVRDTDYDHNHGQGVPHVHDWGRDANGRPVRGPGRPVDPKNDERKPDEKKPEDKKSD